ncbi:MAG TPA: divalent-cation tolerance protein CutA [Polyangia bacterium]|jgi:periplasmic divalent cation tolerance protein
MPRREHILVLTTAPSSEVAADIGRTVVDEGLAACVNVVPGLRSIYRWEGQLCDDAEVLCLMKTRAELFEPLRARIVGLHPYQVAEVIALPITAGSAPYLDWLDACTRAG